MYNINKIVLYFVKTSENTSVGLLELKYFMKNDLDTFILQHDNISFFHVMYLSMLEDHCFTDRYLVFIKK